MRDLETSLVALIFKDQKLLMKPQRLTRSGIRHLELYTKISMSSSSPNTQKY
jgi:hypothetical protein